MRNAISSAQKPAGQATIHPVAQRRLGEMLTEQVEQAFGQLSGPRLVNYHVYLL